MFVVMGNFVTESDEDGVFLQCTQLSMLDINDMKETGCH